MVMKVRERIAAYSVTPLGYATYQPDDRPPATLTAIKLIFRDLVKCRTPMADTRRHTHFRTHLPARPTSRGRRSRCR